MEVDPQMLVLVGTPFAVLTPSSSSLAVFRLQAVEMGQQPTRHMQVAHVVPAVAACHL